MLICSLLISQHEADKKPSWILVRLNWDEAEWIKGISTEGLPLVNNPHAVIIHCFFCLPIHYPKVSRDIAEMNLNSQSR